MCEITDKNFNLVFAGIYFLFQLFAAFFCLREN